MTGCRWMRRMRGDQYGVLRAALFQMVDKKLRVPRSEEAMFCIQRDIQRGCQWIKDWSFGHRLPYGAHNVMQGISDCLTALDRLVVFEYFIKILGSTRIIENLIRRWINYLPK
jgi:Peptidase family C101